MAWVSTAVAGPPTGEAISLYFTLKAGEKADLEVIATAALEWLESARAAAREIEPSAQIRVELVDADESSLRLNTVLDWVESQLEKVDKGGGSYPRLKKLAIALAIFVPTTGVETFTHYFGSKQEVALNETDRKLITEHSRMLHELIERAQKNPDVSVRRQKFFKTLERDPSITGAGVSEGPKIAPIVMIPSDQFAEKGGLWAMVETDPEPNERTIFAWSFSTQPVHGGRKNSIDSIGSLAADIDLKFVNDGIDHEDTDYLRWRR